MVPSELDVAEVVRSVWEAMLHEEIAGPLALDVERPLMSNAIDITGPFVGTVVVSLPPRVAIDAAARFVEGDPATLSAADAQEVVAELTNMIGGNVKALLAGVHQLSLPRPCDVAQFGPPLMQLGFETEAGRFSVQLYQRS